MNTRKLVYWIQLVIYSILLAYIIPVIFDLIETKRLIITTSGIKDALFFGILIPFVVFISNNMKNDFFKVFLALLTLFAALLFLNAGHLL